LKLVVPFELKLLRQLSRVRNSTSPAQPEFVALVINQGVIISTTDLAMTSFTAAFATTIFTDLP